MSPPRSLELLASYGVWLLVALGLSVLIWALFWDRSRGRKRCPKCWYDLSGAAPVVRDGRIEFVCPECGKTARGERALLRTRRRWGAVWALALVALLAWWLPGAARRATARGIIGLAPTTPLVVLVPRFEPDEGLPSAWADEVRVRCEQGQIAPWQVRLLCHGVQKFRWHRRAVVGALMPVEASQPLWLGGAVEITLAEPAEFIDSSDTRSYATRILPGADDSTERLRIGPVPKDARALIVSYRAQAVGAEEPCVLQRSLDIRAVNSASEVMGVVDAPAFTDRIRRMLDVSMIGGTRDESGRKIRLDGISLLLDDSSDDEAAQVALFVTIEMRRDGRPMLEVAGLLEDFGARSSTFWVGSDTDQPEVAWDPHDETELKRWTVLVRGEPERALEDLGRERAWKGEFEVPLRATLKQGWGQDTGDDPVGDRGH